MHPVRHVGIELVLDPRGGETAQVLFELFDLRVTARKVQGDLGPIVHRAVANLGDLKPGGLHLLDDLLVLVGAGPEIDILHAELLGQLQVLILPATQLHGMLDAPFHRWSPQPGVGGLCPRFGPGLAVRTGGQQRSCHRQLAELSPPEVKLRVGTVLRIFLAHQVVTSVTHNG